MNHRGVELSTLRAELQRGCVAVPYNTPDMRAELVRRTTGCKGLPTSSACQLYFWNTTITV